MRKREHMKRLLCLGLASLMSLSLAACKNGADKQDSAQSSIQPTAAPTETVQPTPGLPFTDVPEDAYYYDAVKWALKKGIASGTSDTQFNPTAPCTRGEAITFLWRAMGSPEPLAAENPISDISSSDWYYKPVLWAYENGISSSTTFNPGKNCTNGEALTFLWRAEDEPAASVYNSALASAAPGEYYARALAWADNNGMFTGMDSAFAPAAPCSRADIVTCLYWAAEQWRFSEADRAVQAEYKQIINDAQLYEVNGSGLCYADYIDVEGDGKAELLTLSSSGNLTGDTAIYAYDVTATVYANMNGHAGKLCDQTFSWGWDDESLSICKNGNQVCLRNSWLHMGTSSAGDVFWTIANGAFWISDSVTEDASTETLHYINSEGEYIPQSVYNTILEQYTAQTGLLSYNRSFGISVHDRGLLPDPAAARQKVYAAVKNGDFSAFAGTYVCQFADIGWPDIILDANGVLTISGDKAKPISIEITENGAITCLTQEYWDSWEGTTFQVRDYYEIFPVGVDNNSNQVSIYYAIGVGGLGGSSAYWYKVS